ncbi:hypothetical protein DV738_g3923, partial [Chaetothyriales sp. CBS 135597]
MSLDIPRLGGGQVRGDALGVLRLEGLLPTQIRSKDANQRAAEKKSPALRNGTHPATRPRVTTTGEIPVKRETDGEYLQLARATPKPQVSKDVPGKAPPKETPKEQRERIFRQKQQQQKPLQIQSVGSTPLAHRPGPASPSLTVPWTPSPVSCSPGGRSTKFTLEVSLSQDRAPARLREDFKLKKRKLFRELKQSTRPALERLAEVEEYFGQTGFSADFSTKDTEEEFQQAASKKLRHVDRSRIALNWGQTKTGTSINTSRAPLLLRRLRELDGSGTTVVAPRHPVEQVQDIFSSRFNDQHYGPPIRFANNINNRHLSGKFQFVSEYIIHPGVKLTDHGRNIGCSCVGVCEPATCECLTKQIPDGPNLQIETYSRGRTVPLEIFQTPSCGFGVRSPSRIQRGQFIELYLGEVITQEELERREDAKEEGASSYVFSLDFFKSSLGQECYHVDGEYFGTAMRFVNHSCSPNARSFTVVRGRKNPRDMEKAEGDADNDEGRVRCQCGASNCRKWLWPPMVRKRKRKQRRSPGKDGP